jgi:hypothetical protein
MTSTKTLVLGAIMAAALIVPAAARAENTTAPVSTAKETMKMKPSFEEADTNKDGSISLQEFLARHEAKFKEIDTNSDGKLTKEEFQAYGESMKKMMDERRERMKEHKNGIKEPTTGETKAQ